MIWLQWLTGMRPCEAVIMRACDIDMSGEVWLSTMAISLLPHVSRVEVVNQSVIERISGLLVGSKTVSVAPMREMLVVDRLLLHNA